MEKVKEDWYAIPVARCRRLIELMQGQCYTVFNQQAFPTKYLTKLIRFELIFNLILGVHDIEALPVHLIILNTAH